MLDCHLPGRRLAPAYVNLRRAIFIPVERTAVSEETSQFDTIETAIAAIQAGEMVVVVDDDDRENEGDLIMAASKATSEAVAWAPSSFMSEQTTSFAPSLAKRSSSMAST